MIPMCKSNLICINFMAKNWMFFIGASQVISYGRMWNHKVIRSINLFLESLLSVFCLLPSSLPWFSCSKQKAYSLRRYFQLKNNVNQCTRIIKSILLNNTDTFRVMNFMVWEMMPKKLSTMIILEQGKN